MRNKNKGKTVALKLISLSQHLPLIFWSNTLISAALFMWFIIIIQKKNLVLEICKAAEQETKHSSCSISAASLALIKAADFCFPVARPCKHYREFKGGTHGACNEEEEWGLVLCVCSYQPVYTRQSRQCEIWPAFPRSPFKMHNFIYSCSSTGCVRVCVWIL